MLSEKEKKLRSYIDKKINGIIVPWKWILLHLNMCNKNLLKEAKIDLLLCIFQKLCLLNLSSTLIVDSQFRELCMQMSSVRIHFRSLRRANCLLARHSSWSCQVFFFFKNLRPLNANGRVITGGLRRACGMTLRFHGGDAGGRARCRCSCSCNAKARCGRAASSRDSRVPGISWPWLCRYRHRRDAVLAATLTKFYKLIKSRNDSNFLPTMCRRFRNRPWNHLLSLPV